MEHLALEIFDLPTATDKNPTTSQFAALDDGASITITDTSEVFASGDVWSYSFTLNIRANAHILGSAGDMHGSRLHDLLHHRRARLWVEGIAIYLGYLMLDDEAEVDADGNVDVTFESGQKTFDQMIEGAKANQVPMMDDVLIGLALWRKRWTSCTVNLKASAKFKNDRNSMASDVYYRTEPHSGTIGTDLPLVSDGEEDDESAQEYPRYVFPKLPAGTFEDLGGSGLTEIDCLNTDYPYDDAHPYCNVALCYQKQGYHRKHEDGSEWDDYSQEPEAQRDYEYMPANRVNSAPNFYVIYWLKALMKHLGINIQENQMMDVQDLRRLFFVNTACAHKEPKKLRTVDPDPHFGKLRFTGSGRKIARLVPEYFGAQRQEEHLGVLFDYYRRGDNVKPESSKLTCTSYDVSEKTELYDEMGGIDHVIITVDDVQEWNDNDRATYEQNNGYLYKAYASSECFPDVDISEVIKAIEDGFGVRLLFSDNFSRVRIVLLRNLFRNQDIQQITCDVISEIKVENSTRGFRMTYGDSEDTQFYYKGFNDKLPHKKPYFIDDSDQHDYSHWSLNALYKDIIRRISAFDKTCYVTPVNGNAYGIKVDKDAKRYDELHPSLFEYAGYMDAEDGDCTGEEETIKTISVGFKPAIVNDLNMEQEREATKDSDRKQRFALFLDDTMRPRRPDLSGADSPYNDSDAYYPIYGKNGLYGEDSKAAGMKADDGIVKPGEFGITSDMYTMVDGKQLRAILYASGIATHPKVCKITFDIEGAVNEGYRLYLQDNYEPNDDGISPIEKHDWGLTLGIMRGSGADMSVDYSADPDDGEGNDTWDLEPGDSVASHPDTCDSYGNLWDYNGQQPGPGYLEDRISLKLRAEKPNPYFDPNQAESSENPRYLSIENEDLQRRGLIDTCYKEYSYWVRNARICRRTVHITLADLLKIDKTKRVQIADVTGFIRKIQYTVDKKQGLGMVEFEIMYI